MSTPFVGLMQPTSLTIEQRGHLLQLISHAFSEIASLCQTVSIDGFFQSLDPPSNPFTTPLADLYGQVERQRQARPLVLAELEHVHRAQRIGTVFETLLPLLSADSIRPVDLLGYLDGIDGTPTRWGSFVSEAATILELTLPDKRQLETILQCLAEQSSARSSGRPETQ